MTTATLTETAVRVCQACARELTGKNPRVCDRACLGALLASRAVASGPDRETLLRRAAEIQGEWTPREKRKRLRGRSIDAMIRFFRLVARGRVG